jgi:hypothetical protein
MSNAYYNAEILFAIIAAGVFLTAAITYMIAVLWPEEDRFRHIPATQGALHAGAEQAEARERREETIPL